MTGFDQNFCFPVPPALDNARLRLVPWDPSLHSTVYVQSVSPHPELFNYLPFGPFDSLEVFKPWFEKTVHSNPTYITFAIFDKTSSNDGKEAFAGMIGLLHASPQHLSAEIGLITILPAFQRTHVSSNALGLVLQWLLDPLSPSRGGGMDVTVGLGLRRVYWNANTLNVRSIALAQRLGLKLEAVLRWDRVLPANRSAFAREEKREGDPKVECPGRDTARLAICWDDWITGGREIVLQVMERVG